MSKVILTKVWPTVDLALNQKGVPEKIQKHMSDVIGSDRLMNALEKTHPGETVYFGDKETSADQVPIYKALELDPLVVRKAVKETGIVNPSWVHANKPLYWTMMNIIRHRMTHGTEEQTKMAVMFLTVAMYAGLQFRYFRRFYQPQVMAYAMNTIDTKFTLKQEGTMIKALMVIAWRCHQKYAPDLKKGEDVDFLRYTTSMFGRLNGFVKALKSHYEDTRAAGRSDGSSGTVSPHTLPR